jgi:hypothetical protein
MCWTSIGITPTKSFKSTESSNTNDKAIETSLCNGDSHSDVLEYMEVHKWLDL